MASQVYGYLSSLVFYRLVVLGRPRRVVTLVLFLRLRADVFIGLTQTYRCFFLCCPRRACRIKWKFFFFLANFEERDKGAYGAEIPENLVVVGVAG